MHIAAAAAAAVAEAAAAMAPGGPLHPPLTVHLPPARAPHCGGGRQAPPRGRRRTCIPPRLHARVRPGELPASCHRRATRWPPGQSTAAQTWAGCLLRTVRRCAWAVLPSSLHVALGRACAEVCRVYGLGFPTCRNEFCRPCVLCLGRACTEVCIRTSAAAVNFCTCLVESGCQPQRNFQ
eukprot:359032-Chlamydomonas_euryale.AAC.9